MQRGILSRRFDLQSSRPRSILCETPAGGLRSGQASPRTNSQLPASWLVAAAPAPPPEPGRRATEQRNELAPLHSITSSAVASSVDGISRPITFAVLRLITSLNLV